MELKTDSYLEESNAAIKAQKMELKIRKDMEEARYM